MSSGIQQTSATAITTTATNHTYLQVMKSEKKNNNNNRRSPAIETIISKDKKKKKTSIALENDLSMRYRNGKKRDKSINALCMCVCLSLLPTSRIIFKAQCSILDSLLLLFLPCN